MPIIASHPRIGVTRVAIAGRSAAASAADLRDSFRRGRQDARRVAPMSPFRGGALLGSPRIDRSSASAVQLGRCVRGSRCGGIWRAIHRIPGLAARLHTAAGDPASGTLAASAIAVARSHGPGVRPACAGGVCARATRMFLASSTRTCRQSASSRSLADRQSSQPTSRRMVSEVYPGCGVAPEAKRYGYRSASALCTPSRRPPTTAWLPAG